MIYLVCGPPGSGKTTYALEHMTEGDAVIDFDRLFAAISGQPEHVQVESLHEMVEDLRMYLLATLDDYPSVRHVWIVMCAARRSDRDYWESRGATVVLLDLPVNECMGRLTSDPTRNDDAVMWEPAVRKWWATFELTNG